MKFFFCVFKVLSQPDLDNTLSIPAANISAKRQDGKKGLVKVNGPGCVKMVFTL